ncbi:MAG: hypothetical protein MUC50_02130 [Myxococcota bacterium]|nr:hypothetical protein [Myxococcota bacterium]
MRQRPFHFIDQCLQLVVHAQGALYPLSALHLRDATALATTTRQAVIDLLHERVEPA